MTTVTLATQNLKFLVIFDKRSPIESLFNSLFNIRQLPNFVLSSRNCSSSSARPEITSLISTSGDNIKASFVIFMS